VAVKLKFGNNIKNTGNLNLSYCVGEHLTATLTAKHELGDIIVNPQITEKRVFF